VPVYGATESEQKEGHKHHLEGGAWFATCYGPAGKQHLLNIGREYCSQCEKSAEDFSGREEQVAWS
jgi:hypothetical protein